MKLFIAIVLVITSCGFASSQYIVPDKTVVNNITTSLMKSDLNETTTYTFVKDIDNSKKTEIIKVRFKNAFRGADQDIATVDRIWQVSDTDPTKIIRNDSNEVIVTSGTPLKLEEGYELQIMVISIDGSKMDLELTKEGEVVDSIEIRSPLTMDDFYTYSNNVGAADAEIIKVHFKSASRGADQDIAAIDQIWQVSDTDPTKVIRNDSNEVIVTSGTPLKLEEGYELRIKSIDINGVKAYVELSKDGKAVGYALVLPSAAFFYERGINFYDQSKYDEAIKAFDEAVKIDPRNAAVWYSNSLALEELGEHDEATQAYEEAIAIDPDYVSGRWSHKGWNLSNQGKYEEAVKAYDEAIKLDPNYATAWVGKSDALDNLGKHEEAAKAYDEAIKISPYYAKDAASHWNDKGNILYDLGKYSEATKDYDEAIKIDPKYKWAWNNKGLALVAQERYDESIEAYDRAIKIDPKWATPRNNKGLALFAQGKYDEVIETYDELIKLNSSEPIYWITKGNALFAQGKYDEVIETYDELIKLNSSEPIYWINKGDALDGLGKYDEAIQAYDEAIRLDPDWILILGEEHFDAGEYVAAIKYFDEAIRLDPNDAAAWYEKGRTLEALGRTAEATAAFIKANDLGYVG